MERQLGTELSELCVSVSALHAGVCPACKCLPSQRCVHECTRALAARLITRCRPRAPPVYMTCMACVVRAPLVPRPCPASAFQVPLRSRPAPCCRPAAAAAAARRGVYPSPCADPRGTRAARRHGSSTRAERPKAPQQRELLKVSPSRRPAPSAPPSSLRPWPRGPGPHAVPPSRRAARRRSAWCSHLVNPFLPACLARPACPGRPPC